MQLTDFSTLTFDCYGTLIDWESGIIAGLAPLTERLKRALSRNDILAAHAHYESTQQQQTPTKRYRELLAIVYKRLAEAWGIRVTWDECVRYGESINTWPAFPDSAAALGYLKQYYRLVILSNVDNESFSASHAKLGADFDAIYTAEDIGNYKPAAANFTHMITMLERRGIHRSELLHTAESLFHDHAPANRHGLRSCWIYRRYDQAGSGATMPPEAMPTYDFCFRSMAEMVDAHRREIAAS